MSGWLRYGYVPEGEIGWDGNWGTVDLQGPAEDKCQRCGITEREHRSFDYGHRFEGTPIPPKPHEIAQAYVTTEWTCPYCGADNDVLGEGAVGTWMECSSCHKHAWLEMGQ